jgi:hypothetical protein
VARSLGCLRSGSIDATRLAPRAHRIDEARHACLAERAEERHVRWACRHPVADLACRALRIRPLLGDGAAASQPAIAVSAARMRPASCSGVVPPVRGPRARRPTGLTPLPGSIPSGGALRSVYPPNRFGGWVRGPLRRVSAFPRALPPRRRSDLPAPVAEDGRKLAGRKRGRADLFEEGRLQRAPPVPAASRPGRACCCRAFRRTACARAPVSPRRVPCDLVGGAVLASCCHENDHLRPSFPVASRSVPTTILISVLMPAPFGVTRRVWMPRSGGAAAAGGRCAAGSESSPGRPRAHVARRPSLRRRRVGRRARRGFALASRWSRMARLRG